MEVSLPLFVLALLLAAACGVTAVRAADPFADRQDAEYRTGAYLVASWAALFASNILSFIGL